MKKKVLVEGLKQFSDDGEEIAVLVLVHAASGFRERIAIGTPPEMHGLAADISREDRRWASAS